MSCFNQNCGNLPQIVIESHTGSLDCGWCPPPDPIIRVEELPETQDAKGNAIYWMNDVGYVLSTDKTKFIPLNEPPVIPYTPSFYVTETGAGNYFELTMIGTKSNPALAVVFETPNGSTQSTVSLLEETNQYTKWSIDYGDNSLVESKLIVTKEGLDVPLYEYRPIIPSLEEVQFTNNIRSIDNGMINSTPILQYIDQLNARIATLEAK